MYGHYRYKEDKKGKEFPSQITVFIQEQRGNIEFLPLYWKVK